MRRWVLVLALASCFDPAYSDETLCGPAGECPSGRTCADGTHCLATAPVVDAPLIADAPSFDAPRVIDAPPPPIDAPPILDAPAAFDAPVIVADAPVDAGPLILEVLPLYPANGAGWNDHLANDGPGPSVLSGAACPPGAPTGYDRCVHGGELRVVGVPGRASCAGLTLEEALGAFDWFCDPGTNPVRFVSIGLHPSARLADLLSPSGFRPNSVIVRAGATVIGQSTPGAWWPNPVIVNTTELVLGQVGAIYFFTADPAARHVITADKVALVGAPGIVMTGAAASQPLLYAGDVRHLWIEGRMNATGMSFGVELQTVHFSTLRQLEVVSRDGPNAEKTAVKVSGSRGNRLAGLILDSPGQHGLHLIGSRWNDVADVDGVGLVYHVYLNASSHTRVRRVRAAGGYEGVTVGSGHNNIIMNVQSAGTVTAVHLSEAASNVVLGVLAANAFRGIFVIGPDNDVVAAALFNTEQEGVITGWTPQERSHRAFLGFITSVNHRGSAIRLNDNGDQGITVRAAVGANSGFAGLEINGAPDCRVRDVVLADNGSYGVRVANGSDGCTFSGLLDLGANGTGAASDCHVENSAGVNIVHLTCGTSGATPPTVERGVSTRTSLAGKVAADGNPASTSGTAPFSGIDTFDDWLRFDNPFRGWGIDGSVYPGESNRGQCGAGTCRIWDLSARTADGGRGGAALIRARLAAPQGNDTRQHRWRVADATECAAIPGAEWLAGPALCVTTALAGTWEIGGGNGNGLCESGEICLQTRNIGAYQGHGALVAGDAFVDGVVTGVRLVRHELNGR